MILRFGVHIAPFIAMGKAAKGTGVRSQVQGGAGPQRGRCGRDRRRGRVQINRGRGASSRKCGPRDLGAGGAQIDINKGRGQRLEAELS